MDLDRTIGHIGVGPWVPRWNNALILRHIQGIYDTNLWLMGTDFLNFLIPQLSLWEKTLIHVSAIFYKPKTACYSVHLLFWLSICFRPTFSVFIFQCVSGVVSRRVSWFPADVETSEQKEVRGGVGETNAGDQDQGDRTGKVICFINGCQMQIKIPSQLQKLVQIYM